MNHFDSSGNARMSDISEKAPTARRAVAAGRIKVNAAVIEALGSGTAKKGDVLGVARLAGIMAVKRTADIIPLAHPVGITGCTVDFEVDEEAGAISAVCTVKTEGRTGVEMEALTGVSAALLTVYDMCKAMDRSMEIGGIRLLEKTGGKSGDFSA